MTCVGTRIQLSNYLPFITSRWQANRYNMLVPHVDSALFRDYEWHQIGRFPPPPQNESYVLPLGNNLPRKTRPVIKGYLSFWIINLPIVFKVGLPKLHLLEKSIGVENFEIFSSHKFVTFLTILGMSLYFLFLEQLKGVKYFEAIMLNTGFFYCRHRILFWAKRKLHFGALKK